MSDLDQDDIDSLLSGDASVDQMEVAAEPVIEPEQAHQEYDFKNPVRLLKEQLNTLRHIHDTFAQTVGVTLSAFLRSEMTVRLDQLEQLTFQDYIASLPKPTCTGIFDMQPLNGYGFIQLDFELILPFIDKMLGGNGQPLPIERNLTELEVAIAHKILNVFLKELRHSWAYVMDLSLNLKEIKTNPSFIRVVSLREHCIVCTYLLKMGDVEGHMTTCVPYLNLEPIAFRLGSDHTASKQVMKQTPEMRQAHESNFRQIDMELSAVLGHTTISMSDLLFMKEGDILSLDHRTVDPIEVRVEGCRKFKASPGLFGKYRGVLIRGEFPPEVS